MCGVVSNFVRSRHTCVHCHGATSGECGWTLPRIDSHVLQTVGGERLSHVIKLWACQAVVDGHVRAVWSRDQSVGLQCFFPAKRPLSAVPPSGIEPWSRVWRRTAGHMGGIDTREARVRFPPLAWTMRVVAITTATVGNRTFVRLSTCVCYCYC